MVKEEGKEIEGQIAEAGFGVKIPLEEPQQDEPRTPTTDEQTATLQAQMDELRTKYEQADKGLRTAQATLTQKDRLLKEKENVRAEIETLKSMVKILATQRGQGFDEDTDDLETSARKKNPDIDKAFADLEQQQKTREYRNQLQDTIASYQQRVEVLGLTEDDEEYWELGELVTSNDPMKLKRADIRLKKLEKEKEVTPVDNKPTDERKQIETLTKEVERLKKIASGELDTETGLPSGASANEAQVRKTFRENPHSAKAIKDYLEMKASKIK